MKNTFAENLKIQYLHSSPSSYRHLALLEFLSGTHLTTGLTLQSTFTIIIIIIEQQHHSLMGKIHFMIINEMHSHQRTKLLNGPMVYYFKINRKTQVIKHSIIGHDFVSIGTHVMLCRSNNNKGRVVK